MADFDPTAWRPLGGKSRNYYNPETGEQISRRKFDKMRGIFYEEKAEANKKADIAKALSRPARGRKKSRTQDEVEQEIEKYLSKKAAKEAAKAKPRKITPKLLKDGNKAARVKFTTFEEFEALRQQMLDVKSPARPGFRLITSYAIGIVGFDRRDPERKPIGAALTGLQSPQDKVTEKELGDMVEDFIGDHAYFVFSYLYLHLHYDSVYARQRFEAKEEKERERRIQKNVPQYVIDQYHKKAK